MVSHYVVKSAKKHGSYFGKFKTADEALEASVKANEDERGGADDWEPEEKSALADEIKGVLRGAGYSYYFVGENAQGVTLRIWKD